MKNKYSLFLLFALGLVSSGLMAQNIRVPQAQMRAQAEEKPYYMNQPQSAIAAFGDTISGMYWDFASGFPSNWTMVDNSGSGNNWEYTTDSVINCVFVNNFKFASTTASDGYMLFFGNKFNADAACTTYLGDTPWDGYIQTNELDLSAYNSVILKFQHAYRFCCAGNAALSVFVSNDTINWTEYKVNTLPPNTASTNPTNVSLNISSVAAGQSKVYIRFHLYNTAHYYWTVDDVAVTEGATNDVQLTTEAADYNYQYGGFYTQMPLAQASTSNITW
ncbi:MAG: hypothetical protein KDD36_10630 [Flavobacteriales bacterium]|nr:hypothetical protein [Flavobacteriales bacterium]